MRTLCFCRLRFQVFTFAILLCNLLLHLVQKVKIFIIFSLQASHLSLMFTQQDELKVFR